jgi:AcrR family transcriptional regulator
MTGPVKKRTYDATTRRAQSAATRQRIIDSGRELIVERGYRATTIAAIAERAEVNTATIYELVGRKPVLLRELVEQALSGADRPIAGADRDYVRAMRAEPDAAAKLEIYARAVTQIQSRLAPLFLALREASATEPGVAVVWQEIGDRRAANMRLLVADLATTGQLRVDLSHEDAADIIWATNSPELYVMLTSERAWAPGRFERWLADTWRRILLEDPAD